jgi:hypothetical protein
VNSFVLPVRFFFVSFVFFNPGCLQLDALKSRRWVEEEVEEE